VEGIVSKRAGSLYRSSPSRSWLKTKSPDFVRTFMIRIAITTAAFDAVQA
jgi:ATP-dependent DNA ligase